MPSSAARAAAAARPSRRSWSVSATARQPAAAASSGIRAGRVGAVGDGGMGVEVDHRAEATAAGHAPGREPSRRERLPAMAEWPS